MSLIRNEISVIGHKNPDTDSICSAISYAYLKNQEEQVSHYVPKRAGQLNGETKFVLQKFGVKPPTYVTDIGTQVKDIEIRRTPGVERVISLKKAWMLMKELNVVTLPVVKNGRLEGIITTEDIAEAYMDVHDSRILSTAHTKFRNIMDTIDGTMLVGNPEEYYTEGKVLIATANSDMMEAFIEKEDLVILSNRHESQVCAIEMNAACIIVAADSEVAEDIRKLAEERGCSIIRSPHDTYTIARLINQSMPISYFMRRENIVTFRTDEMIDDIKGIMAKKRFRDFPIIDAKGKYVGMISRRNVLNAGRKKVIMVDHNEKKQAVDGLDGAEVIEIIDHHRIGAVETITPIYFRNQPLGCTATIIYQMFMEKEIEIPSNIAGLLLGAIISDTLMYRSPTCTGIDKMAAEHLAKIAGVNVEEFATEMFTAGSDLQSKPSNDIFYQDFKKFVIEGVEFGIGQVNLMGEQALEQIRERMTEYIEENYKASGLDMIFFMMTDIMEESTELLFRGNRCEELLTTAFGVKCEGNCVRLKGVVSRKKQLLPPLMSAIQD